MYRQFIKKVFKFFPMFLTLILLSGCNSKLVIDNNSSIKNIDDNNNEISSVKQSPYQNLSIIENRCRGCGRCAQIDSEHFSMRGRTAKVISTDNLDSSKLSVAVSMCHDRAIALS